MTKCAILSNNTLSRYCKKKYREDWRKMTPYSIIAKIVR